MFGLSVKSSATKPVSSLVQTVRTYFSLKKGKLYLHIKSLRKFFTNNISVDVPTVYEPLPKKRGGENAISYLHKQLVQKYDPTGKRRALVDSKTGLRAGDVIKVTYMDRTDVVGRVLGIKRGQNNVGTNILIRNKINRVGCEVRIPLFSPKLRNIEVLYKPKKYLSRAKQYYIRNTKLDVDDVEAYVKRQQHK